MSNIQRYNRLRTEYDHYERRHRMLHSITLQKRDELDNLMNNINQLLILEDNMNNFMKTGYECVYDHGDHPLMSSIVSLEKVSFDEDEESENDPLLQRLKLTKPTRLKTSSKQILNNDHTIINFTNSNILDKVHTVYDKYLSE